MSNILAVTAELKRCSIACRFNGQVFELNKDLDASTYLVKFAQDFCEDHNIDLTKIENHNSVRTGIIYGNSHCPKLRQRIISRSENSGSLRELLSCY